MPTLWTLQFGPRSTMSCLPDGFIEMEPCSICKWEPRVLWIATMVCLPLLQIPTMAIQKSTSPLNQKIPTKAESLARAHETWSHTLFSSVTVFTILSRVLSLFFSWIFFLVLRFPFCIFSFFFGHSDTALIRHPLSFWFNSTPYHQDLTRDSLEVCQFSSGPRRESFNPATSVLRNAKMRPQLKILAKLSAISEEIKSELTWNLEHDQLLHQLMGSTCIF